MVSLNLTTIAARLVKKTAALLALGVMVTTAQPAHAQEPLSFFKNYFVTGDYEVYGESLFGKGKNGFADAKIEINGFPEDTVDLVAAFLYLQTSEETQWSGIDHAKFNGYDLGPGDNSFAKALNWDAATPTCWITSSNMRRKVTYRADVLRFLPVKENGKHAVNGSHSISAPDSGRFTFFHNDGNYSDDNTGPWVVGASLLLVYRDPLKPLRAIVIYDGGFRKQPKETMVQPIKWYDDVASVNPMPKMTHIVGVGTLLSDKVFVDGLEIATNAFRSADGLLWDNWTTTGFSLPPHDDAMVVTVGPDRRPSDCLAYSAIVVAVNADDPDNDGLLTRWETAPPPIRPDGRSGPDLAAMGADPLAKDIFVEIAYEHAAEGTKYGGVPKPAHTHLPKLEAFKMVGDTLKNAPVANPNGTTGIKIHFDVGSEYHDAAGNPLSEYIIPSALALGGKNVSETKACWDTKGTEDPEDDELAECTLPDGSQGPLPGQFPDYPAVGWKTGFAFLQNVILGFDDNRKAIFNYILSVHFLAIPKEPCLNPDGTANFQCQDTNPDFHVPRTYSGIHDFPGGHGMLALGGFEDELGLPVGTIKQQAGTLLHELGHGFELTHSGPQVLDPSVPRRDNCMPYYHSSMNYAYQFGLTDDQGAVHVDFSGESVERIDENFLSDGSLLPLPPGALRYRSTWYTPKATSYLNVLGTPAKKHCDGSELLTETLPDGTVVFTEPPMVRIEGASVAGGIDWQANGLVDLGFTQDINFNGVLTDLGNSANDWPNVRLNQVGGSRNVGGYYIDLSGRNAVGPMSLDVGRGDIGRGDIGRGDIGRGDIGRGDIGVAVGRGDIGRGDIGRGDIGRGDIGRGDIGRGDIGRGAFGGGDTDVGAADEPFVELDLETAQAIYGETTSPPAELRACLTVATEGGFICAPEGSGDRPVLLDWEAGAGAVAAYHVYRFEYDPEAVFPPATLPTAPIATVFAPEFGTAPTTYLDTSAPGGASLAYFVIAQLFDETFSAISNFATVATPIRTEIASLDLSSTTLTIGGANVPYTASLTNASGTTLPGVLVQAFIDQDAADASRAGGFSMVNCTETLGDLPPGSCTFNFTVLASNTTAGTGTLVPGSAIARFEMIQGETLLDTYTVPVTLVSGTITGGGTITDPAGDTLPSEFVEPDLVSASVLVAGGNITLRVRFATGTFNPATSVAQFVLDTDQNAATGHAGTDAGCIGDNGVIGAEYIVDLGSTFYGTQASVAPFVGPGCNQFGGSTPTPPGSVVYLADGLDVSFPLSMVGNDDGLLNFKVVSSRYLGEAFTGVIDRATDAGSPPGIVEPEG